MRLNIFKKEQLEILYDPIIDTREFREKKFGKIDVLINLAAIDAKFDKAIDQIPKTSFEHFPLDIWKKSIDVNITGTFIMTQGVVREMIKKQRGNIRKTEENFT